MSLDIYAGLPELERTAMREYACPRRYCEAKPGDRCLKGTATNNYWDRHYCKHPHAERIARARADITDQGRADW